MNTLSFSVRTWRDPHSGTVRMRVIRMDQEEEVTLPATSFLLRIPVAGTDDPEDEANGASPRRCYIRHIPTAREAYVQGGPGLYAFVEACLLTPDGPDDPAPPEASNLDPSHPPDPPDAIHGG